MSMQAWIVALFIAGVVAQGALFTRGVGGFARKLDLLLLAGFFIAGCFFSWMDPELNVYMGLLVSFFIFPCLLALIHSSEILPRVTEKVLLSSVITFWFMFFATYYTGTRPDKWLALACLLPTAGTLAIAFTSVKLNAFWRIFFYGWFLVMVVLTGLHQFLHSYLMVFRYAAAGGGAGELALWTFPLAGMAYCQLAAYCAILLQFLPMKSRRESFAQARENWKSYMRLVDSRYDEASQFTRLGALGLLAAQGGAMYLNYRYRFMPAEALINIGLLLPLAIMALTPEPPETYDPLPRNPEAWADHVPSEGFGEFVQLEEKIAGEAGKNPGPK